MKYLQKKRFKINLKKRHIKYMKSVQEDNVKKLFKKCQKSGIILTICIKTGI